MGVEGGMAEFLQSKNWKRLEAEGENHLLSSMILSRVSEVIREVEMNLPKGKIPKVNTAVVGETWRAGTYMSPDFLSLPGSKF